MKTLTKGKLITGLYITACLVVAYFVIKHIRTINKTIKTTE